MTKCEIVLLVGGVIVSTGALVLGYFIGRAMEYRAIFGVK